MNQWIVSPRWDSIWILNGIVIYAFFTAFQLLGFSEGPHFKSWLSFFVLIASGAHLLAPMINAVVIREIRYELIRKKGFCLGVLGILFVTSLGTFFGPMEFVGGMHSLVFLSLIFYFFNLRHLTMQHFGVLSLYRSRVKSSDDKSKKNLEKRLDYGFCLLISSLLIPLMWIHVRLGSGLLFRFSPGFQIPNNLLALILALSVVATGVIVYFEFKKKSRSLARMMYCLSVGIQPLLLWMWNPVYFVLVTRVNHWLVEIGLSSRLMGNKKKMTSMIWVLGLFFVVGSALNYAHYRLGLKINHITQEGVIWHASLLKTAFSVSAFPLLSGLYLSLIFLHFFTDHWIYRTRYARERLRS